MSRQLRPEELAAPGSPVWSKTITASKIPTILGLSRWQTASELWMEMTGLVEPERAEGEHLDFGHDLEDSLIKHWRRHNPGWQTNKGEIAYTDPDLPFPNQATLDRRARRGRAYQIIECKGTSSRDTWGDPEDDIPAHVAAQVIGQMGISGIHRANVVVLAGYDKPLVPRIYTVEWDSDLWAGIVDALADFYDSLGESEPPLPPADVLAALTPRDHRDGDIELEAGEFAQLEALTAQRDELDADIDAERERLVGLAGDAKRVIVDGTPRIIFTKGRFAAKRVPEEARHLLKDPDVLKTEPKLDSKKFATKYPDVAAAATGEPTPTFK